VNTDCARGSGQEMDGIPISSKNGIITRRLCEHDVSVNMTSL
jgi:hypothetical protein